jgi:hypothetical protein
MHAQQSLLSASASTTTLSLSHSRSGDSPAAALTQGANPDMQSVLERIGSESSMSDACGKGKEPVLDCVEDSDERAADGSEDCELVLLRTPRAHGVDGDRDGDASEVYNL